MTGTPTQAHTSRQPHRLRADASRNRERIVTAAREAFVERGPDIPLDEIARRAGVGNATLYRNFADRGALTRTVTLSVLTGTAERAEAALTGSPTRSGPWRALSTRPRTSGSAPCAPCCPGCATVPTPS